MKFLSLAMLTATLVFGQHRADVQVQKAAMKKLAFLAGRWTGTATATVGPGKPQDLRQTEEIEFRLDGLILVIEGTGRDPETGKVLFNAFATISWDERSNAYKIRAYTAGNIVDTEFRSDGAGYEWGFDSGPAKVLHSMRISETGEWVEKSTVVIGEAPPRPVVEMRLRRQ